LEKGILLNHFFDKDNLTIYQSSISKLFCVPQLAHLKFSYFCADDYIPQHRKTWFPIIMPKVLPFTRSLSTSLYKFAQVHYTCRVWRSQDL